jgi:16S rRNA (cytidine1402-2'-O)-methyltransferase
VPYTIVNRACSSSIAFLSSRGLTSADIPAVYGDRSSEIPNDQPMLYLVATPIGNLGDISLRALEILRSVDLIASEDTRHVGVMLAHFGIKKPQISYHEHNEQRSGPKIIDQILQGKSVALITDAGTPGVSDPGFVLVRRAIEKGVSITAVPGPSALILALVLSGLPVHSFTFRGFPPRKPGPRRRFLEVDKESPHTLIFYESPHRLRQFINDAIEVFGDRNAALACELTKMFESVERGALSELGHRLDQREPRGEYTVVIAGAPGRRKRDLPREVEQGRDT